MSDKLLFWVNKRVCPSCGGEAEYLGALLDMSGQEEREYLFWKCPDCRQTWQTKKERGVSP